MQACSYCGRENQEGAASCKGCGGSLVITAGPASSAGQLKVLSAWARVIGFPFAALACLWIVFVASARIDSAEEFDMALRLSVVHALPLVIASFLLAVGLTQHWRPRLRFITTGVAVALVWILCTQLLQHS